MTDTNMTINKYNAPIKNSGTISQFSWNAVGVGVIIGLGAQLVLNLLGLGIGAITFDINAKEIAVNSVASIGWVLLSGIVSMFLGGWASGLLCFERDKVKTAMLGLTVWGAATLITFIFTFSAAGALLNNTFETAKQGIALMGQTTSSLAQAMPQMAESAKNLFFPGLNKAQDQIVQKAEQIFNEEKVKLILNPSEVESLKNELKEIVVTLVTADNEDAINAAKEKSLSFLTNKLGLDKSQAEELTTGWLTKFSQLKDRLTDEATKVKDKATAATENIINYLGTAALITALTFITSAFAAIFGAIVGNKTWSD